MKRGAIWGGLLAAGLVFLLAAPASASYTQPIVVVSLTGTVDPLSARYVERGINTAKTEHASSVLIKIDTPGGLSSSMRSIVQAIAGSKVPVVCWVGPTGARAASAGAIIMLGCPVAAMAPGTNIGAAHPVGFGGQVLDEKVTNDAAAYARALAQAHNRSADIAEKMVRQSISLTAEEALQKKLIDFIEPSEFGVMTHLTGEKSVNGLSIAGTQPVYSFVKMTFIESVLHGIIDPNIIFLLFLFGLVGIIIEILHPGIRLPGVLGVLSFIISLVLLDLLPVNIAGVVLLLVGMALLAFEVHIHTVGIAATLGVTSLILGGLFLFQSSVPNAAVSKGLVVGMAIALAAFFTLVVRVMVQTRRRLPKGAKLQDVVGAEAVVVRALDPIGIVRAHREQWSARATAGTIPEGAHVRVTGVQGLTLHVELLEVSHVSQTEGESR